MLQGLQDEVEEKRPCTSSTVAQLTCSSRGSDSTSHLASPSCGPGRALRCCFHVSALFRALCVHRMVYQKNLGIKRHIASNGTSGSSAPSHNT